MTVPRAAVLFASLAAVAPLDARTEAKPRDGARQQAKVIVPDRYRIVYESWGFAPASSDTPRDSRR